MEKKFIYILGKKLTSLRENSGKDQRQLAKEIGVSRQTVNTWEGKAKAKLTFENATNLTKALGVTIEVLTNDKTGEHFTNFRHQIFDGDYIGLHKRAWDQYEETLAQARSLLETMVANNTKLVDAQSKLVNSNSDLAATIARVTAAREKH